MSSFDPVMKHMQHHASLTGLIWEGQIRLTVLSFLQTKVKTVRNFQFLWEWNSIGTDSDMPSLDPPSRASVVMILSASSAFRVLGPVRQATNWFAYGDQRGMISWLINIKWWHIEMVPHFTRSLILSFQCPRRPRYVSDVNIVKVMNW